MVATVPLGAIAGVGASGAGAGGGLFSGLGSAAGALGSSSLGGGGGLTEILGTVAGAVGAKQSYKRAKKMQQTQMLWSEKMRSTAYQTAVEDLMKAGLNPALAVAGPGPASTPSAPGYQIPASVGTAIGESLHGLAGRAISSAKSARAVGDELGRIKADRRYAEEQARFVDPLATSAIGVQRSQATKNYEEAKLAVSQDKRAQAETRLTDVNKTLGEMMIPSAKAMRDFDASQLGQFMTQAQRFLSRLPNLPSIGVSRGDRWHEGSWDKSGGSTSGIGKSRSFNIRR